MNEYKLTFTISFQEQDDPAARKQARQILESVCNLVPDAEPKLQQVYTDQAPRGIRMT